MAVYNPDVALASDRQILEKDKFESSTDPGQIFLSSLSSEMPRQVLGALGNMAVDAVRWELLGGKKTDEENRIMDVYANNPGLRAGIATKYPKLFNVGLPTQSSAPAPVGRPAIPSMPKPKAQVPTAPVAQKIISFEDGSVGVPEKTYAEFQDFLKGQSDGSDQSGVGDLVDSLNKEYNPGVSFGDKEKLAERYRSPSGDGESTSPEKTLADFGPRFGDKEAKPTMIKMENGSMIRRIGPDEGRQFREYYNKKRDATAASQAAAPPVESSPPPVAAAPVEIPAPRGIDRRSSAEIEAANTLEQKSFREMMDRGQKSISDVLSTIAGDPDNKRSKRAAESLIATIEILPPKFHKQAASEFALMLNTLPDDQAQAVWSHIVAEGGSVKGVSGARAGIINVLKNLKSTSEALKSLSSAHELADAKVRTLSAIPEEKRTTKQKNDLKAAIKTLNSTREQIAEVSKIDSADAVARVDYKDYFGNVTSLVKLIPGEKEKYGGGTAKTTQDEELHKSNFILPTSGPDRKKTYGKMMKDTNVSKGDKKILSEAVKKDATDGQKGSAMDLMAAYAFKLQEGGGSTPKGGVPKESKEANTQLQLASHMEKNIRPKLRAELNLGKTAPDNEIAAALDLTRAEFDTYIANGRVEGANLNTLNATLRSIYPGTLDDADVEMPGLDTAINAGNTWLTRKMWLYANKEQKRKLKANSRGSLRRQMENQVR